MEGMFNFGQAKNPGLTSKAPFDFGNITTKAPPTSHGNVAASRQGRPIGTAAKGPEARPMSSRQGAGFTSKLMNQTGEIKNIKEIFDVNRRVDVNPEQAFRKAEQQINRLVEQSAACKNNGSFTQGLEKAKEAATKEKALRKQKQAANAVDDKALDLAYCVAFNHAVSLQANGMTQEALIKYDQIVKSKQFTQAGRLRVNMGNIYFQQKNYPLAIKMYRRALDIIPSTSKQMRYKILRNIGHGFFKLGQWTDAINSYQNILKGSTDYKTAFNLLLCLYTSGDKLRMKDCYVGMIGTSNQDEESFEEDQQFLKEGSDKLREEMKQKRRQEIRFIVLASKLIAPVIQNDIIEACDWMLQKLKISRYPEVQSQIEIFKALAYVKRKDIDKAIESLKLLQKKDKITMGRVASNISFLYFLENSYKQAQKYVDIAHSYDRFNVKALVNKGNCLFMKNDFMRAKEQYLQAIGVEADCVQALYNLGYVNKKLNLFMEALQALQKLQTIMPIPQAIFQIASIHETIGNVKQALKWYQVLLTKIPTDAGLLSRIGNIFFREDDQQQALHYYMESYRLLPTSIDTNTWLGIYYVKQNQYQKACFYLERASQLQPKEVKWKLMVASCQRRVGNYQKALKIYEGIYQQYPDNMECLKFLTLLCKEMGLDYEQYAKRLKQLELQNASQGYQIAGEQQPEQQQYQQEAQPYVARQAANPRTMQIKKVKPEEDDWGSGGIDDANMGFN